MWSVTVLEPAQTYCVGCGVMSLMSPEQFGLIVILLRSSCLVVVHDRWSAEFYDCHLPGIL